MLRESCATFGASAPHSSSCYERLIPIQNLIHDSRAVDERRGSNAVCAIRAIRQIDIAIGHIAVSCDNNQGYFLERESND
jgi:hypothetical protein